MQLRLCCLWPVLCGPCCCGPLGSTPCIYSAAYPGLGIFFVTCGRFSAVAHCASVSWLNLLALHLARSSNQESWCIKQAPAQCSIAAPPPSLFGAACLPVIVCGVAVASPKAPPVATNNPSRHLLWRYWLVANVAASLKGGEGKKLIGDSIQCACTGGLGNRYAIIQSIACVLPVACFLEGGQWVFNLA